VQRLIAHMIFDLMFDYLTWFRFDVRLFDIIFYLMLDYLTWFSIWHSIIWRGFDLMFDYLMWFSIWRSINWRGFDWTFDYSKWFWFSVQLFDVISTSRSIIWKKIWCSDYLHSVHTTYNSISTFTANVLTSISPLSILLPT
jgi:hypothetical protein